MKHEPTPVPQSNWKWIGIPVIIAAIFMGILYLAMANEPDYMPAQQKKAAGVDVHAKHANASSTDAHNDVNEHDSHSTAEHAEAIAQEEHTDQGAHATDNNSHGH